MSSEILRGDQATIVEPMPWIEVTDPAAAASLVLFEPKAAAEEKEEKQEEKEEQPDRTAEFEARLAAMQSEMQAAAERAVREAREAGRREGESAARNAAQAEVARAVGDLGSAARQLADLRPKLRLQAEADLVRLALEIARRVIRRELTADPEAITGLARTALERLRLQETVSVRMHPEFQEAVRQFLARERGAAHVEVIADPTLERGAIVFETARGRLDASAETQFREIERGLTDRLRAHGI
jgi:flagellar assembly protein FliH